MLAIASVVGILEVKFSSLTLSSDLYSTKESSAIKYHHVQQSS
jgi:hypothetical protein